MLTATGRFLALALLQTSCAFMPMPSSQLRLSTNTPRTNEGAGRSVPSLFNYYDDWANDLSSVYDELTLPLDEV